MAARFDLTRVAKAAAALVALVGGAVFVLGWILDMGAVRQLRPALPGMAISTSFGLFACGVCLLIEGWRGRASADKLVPIVAAAVLALALVNLALVAAQPGRGVDQILFSFPEETARIYMSPATAISLALAAACLLIPRTATSRLAGDLFSGMAGLGLFIAALSLTGYAFDSSALHGVFVFSVMALNTAVVFFVLFLALLFSRPDWGFMKVFTGPGLGSSTLRRLLPFFLLGPFIFCWLTLQAVKGELFDADFRLSVLAIVATVSLIAIAFWSALRENAASADLMESNDRLQRALSDQNILLKEVYHRVKNNLQFIDAMLALESNDLSGAAMPQRLADIRQRLHALARVHQQLVDSADLATLDLRGFLEELCDNMAKGVGVDSRGVEVRTDVAPVRVHLEQAIPIGLIVTELLSNAFKHAFPAGRRGAILVTLQDLGENGSLLSVSDDGVGRAAEGDRAASVGSMIVRSLAAQLNAEMEARSDDGGCRVEIRIPADQH